MTSFLLTGQCWEVHRHISALSCVEALLFFIITSNLFNTCYFLPPSFRNYLHCQGFDTALTFASLKNHAFLVNSGLYAKDDSLHIKHKPREFVLSFRRGCIFNCCIHFGFVSFYLYIANLVFL